MLRFGESVMREVRSSAGKLYIETKHGEAMLLYRIEGGVLSVYHTFTPPEERGQGVAERLALEVVELAKRKGLKIKPEWSASSERSPTRCLRASQAQDTVSRKTCSDPRYTYAAFQ